MYLSFFLPAEGKQHDASMLVDSNLLHALEQNAFSPTGEPMCVFVDPAYPLRVHLATSTISSWYTDPNDGRI